jgi:uncharacterized protein YbjT (DUF2867 family)
VWESGRGVPYDILSPDLKLPTVATRDIAATVARLLLDDTWTGHEEVPLLGPEDVSNNDMAAIASDVLGIRVRYQQIPGQALKIRSPAPGCPRRWLKRSST